MRALATRATVAAMAALLGGLGCADAGAPGSGDEGVEKGARPMRVVRNETAVEVAAGEAIDVVVTRPVGIPGQLQCEWPAAPRIEGRAVRFVRRRVEAPPPEDDGGVTTLHYELEALAPGTARVALEPKAAGPEARCRTVSVDVAVRAKTHG